MAVTTSAEYKLHANISGSGEDTRITHWLAVAVGLVQAVTGRVFDTATFTEYHNGSGTGIIQLLNYPVTSITSVKPYGPDSVAGDALASTTYKCDLVTGELRLTPEAFGYWSYSDLHEPVDTGAAWTLNDGGTFDNEFRSVQVVYVAGFADTACTYDIKLAVWQVMDLLRATGGSNPLLKSENIGDYSYALADATKETGFQARVRDICRGITRGRL